jgi:hypothetical protein
LSVLVALTALSILSPQMVLGQSAWYEGFEQMDPSWKELGGDGRYVVRQHQRTPQIRHTGERSEWISLVGEGGTYIYLGHDVGRPRVIEELVSTVQIRSDRTGIQLLAELTLPRSQHPRTGQPLTTLVRGTTYTTVGKWQQLRIDDLSRHLTRQTRILRNEYGSNVDSREAYISRIVLNVYGGPGTTNVWIDDLDIAGYVETAMPPTASAESLAAPPGSAPSPPATQWQSASIPAPGSDAQQRVRFDRSVLLVDDRPFFVRAVRWRGEPLTVLKVLGFNTVWLDQFPSAELLAQADETGMWLISPAPALPQANPTGQSTAPAPILGPEYRSVLAWDLGEGLGEKQKESVRIWAEQIRAADSRFRRPLIARPESNLRTYSRIADILVLGRPALGSSLELADYAEWLRLRPQLARPGTPVWVVVPTGPEPAVTAQWEAMSPGALPPTGFSSQQLRLVTYLSSAVGARGLLFESHTPMDSTNAAGEVRRVTLELLNLELSLAEPWFADGSFVAMAESTDPEILAAVLHRDRARLVIPIWIGRGAGQVPGSASQRTVSFIVPGVPEADEAHEMAPGRLRWARYKRVTGGTRITIDQFALTAQVLLTQDQLVRTSRSRQAAVIGRRAAELQRRLAELETEQFERLIVPLSLAAPGTPQLKALEADVSTLRRAAREALQKCDRAIAGNNHADAYAGAEEAMRSFRLLERAHWLVASQSVPGSVSSPMLATFATLTGHWTLLRGISQCSPSGSLLPGGDFENPHAWLDAGWDHFQHPIAGVMAQANLAPEAAHSGSFGLRLTVTAADSKQTPQLVESPPIWIASAPVNLEARSLVAIRGWVRIPTPVQGSADGLLVIDSITGPALAQRIQPADQWQEFILYRVCPQSGPVRVTFALSGMGTAYVDDVTIQVLAATPPATTAQTAYPGGVR